MGNVCLCDCLSVCLSVSQFVRLPFRTTEFGALLEEYIPQAFI